MPFKPIDAPNLAAAAASQIRDLIAADVLRPGDPLPGERDLAQRMGISRTSLREALQVLVSEGLLVSRHGSGLWVSEGVGRSLLDPLVDLLDAAPDAVFDYLAFRALFEGEAAALVAEKATKAEREEIARIVAQMAEAREGADDAAEVELDTEFHMAIVEATGNRVTIQIARSLQELLRRGVERHHALVYDQPAERAELLAQHQAIDAAIQAGDAAGARAAMRAHFAHLAEVVRRKEEEGRREALVAERRAWAEERGKTKEGARRGRKGG